MKIIHFQATQGSQVITPGTHVNTHMQSSICRQQNMALHIVCALYIVIPAWQTHMTSSLHMHMFSNANGDLLWSQVSSRHCGALVVRLKHALNWCHSLHAGVPVWVCVCLCMSAVEDEGLYRSTHCDICLVHNVKNLGFPFLKLFKLNRAPDPRLSTEHLPRQPFTAITAPTNSPAPDITDTERDGTVYAALQRRRRQGRAGRTNTHRFMLFPSFETVIKADLIKPVCIIEVLGGNADRVQILTGSMQTSHQEQREILGYEGQTWQRLLRGT